MHRAPRLALAAALLFAASPLAACIESAAAPDDDVADATAPADATSADTTSADTLVVSDTATGADAVPAADITLADVPTGAACPCEPACPTAVISVAQGDTVPALTTLRLSGAGSTGASAIVHYAWSVAQPHGSWSVFRPSAAGAAPDVTLPADVPGTWEIGLVVTDADGARSCEARETVFVTAPEPLYVELVWDTPGDADPSDVGFINGGSAGSDLDLHLLRPDAATADYPEGWFNPTHDLFWGATPPRWGSADAPDAELVRDDTDGAGPESIHVAAPADGATYRVGVHAWDDWGYGPSFATVRVYVRGTLVFELADVELANASPGVGDLWEVATIAWPSGAVAPIADPDAPGTPYVRPAYADPTAQFSR